RKATLVLAGIPEGKLLAAMRGAECIIDVEDFSLPWLNRRAELIDKGSAQLGSFHFARCILQTRDGRLRSERIRALRAPLDAQLHQRIVPEPVEIVAIFVAAGDGHDASRHELDH